MVLLGLVYRLSCMHSGHLSREAFLPRDHIQEQQVAHIVKYGSKATRHEPTSTEISNGRGLLSLDQEWELPNSLRLISTADVDYQHLLPEVERTWKRRASGLPSPRRHEKGTRQVGGASVWLGRSSSLGRCLVPIPPPFRRVWATTHSKNDISVLII